MKKTTGSMSLSNIKISTKFYGLICFLLAITVTVAAIGIFQMQNIGQELEEIAEQDVPLTSKLTEVTVHQLEQSIALERALRFGAELGLNESASGHFEAAKKRFEELAGGVEAELVELERMANEALAGMQSDATRAEVERVAAAVKKIEAAHRLFDKQALEVIHLLETGETEAAELTRNTI